MALTPRLGHIETPEGRLAYHVIGEGRGGWVVWSQWIIQHLDLMWTDPTVEAMVSGLARDELSSVLVQPRGIGLSEPGRRAASVEEQAADLLAVMDAEGIERATIAAIGMGLPALLLAAQHPERVHGLVSYGGPLTGPLVDGAADGWTPDVARESVSTWRRVAADWGSGETLRTWDTGLCTPHNLRLVGMGERCSASPDLARMWIEAFFTYDARPIASQVRVPTRVLGWSGNVYPLTTMRALSDAIPSATYYELPSAHLGDSIGDAWAPVARHVAEVARGAHARYGETERVLVTVLFTDIVRSTEALASAGDAAWAQTLSEYHRIIRREVAAAAGRVVDTSGDGTLCELPAPAAAVRAAQAILRAGQKLGVSTRAGVHVGECERLGDDLAGLAVHVGARIGALAGPGEVLVSRTTAGLIAGSPFVFDSMGEYALKGVPDRWELFRLRDEETPIRMPTPPPPQPTGIDRLVVGVARLTPASLRGLNRLGNALQHRTFANRN